MNSSSASEKSVVILGWVNAAPSAAGCGVLARWPLASTLRLSFSIPRAMPVNRSAFAGLLNRSSLTSKDKMEPRLGCARLIFDSVSLFSIKGLKQDYRPPL
jgi:ABC-type sugar transport system permease subunit